MSHTEAHAADQNAESRPFNEAERTRFHNLLKLAAESPFEGERDSALAAAKRLAKRFGMTLDEAASGGPAPELPQKPRVSRAGPHQKRARDTARAAHNLDNWVANDKARRDAALAEAFERGLDADSRRKKSAQAPRRNGSKRNPYSHATVLLQETSMPMLEISALTGLDIYEVVGLKLKLRTPKSGNRRGK
jgi:hypothetical protein